MEKAHLKSYRTSGVYAVAFGNPMECDSPIKLCGGGVDNIMNWGKIPAGFEIE